MSRGTTYAAALGLAVFSVLFLAWGVVAMGVVGAEGDPFDLAYAVVAVIGIAGALIVRLEPHGMARVLLAMALAQAAIALLALMVGKHVSPVSSVAEILGVNGLFVLLFAASAWLFDRAGHQRPGRPRRVA